MQHDVLLIGNIWTPKHGPRPTCTIRQPLASAAGVFGLIGATVL